MNWIGQNKAFDLSWTHFVTYFQVFVPFNLDHQVPCMNRIPFLWPVNISVTHCWYQILSHSVQWPQLKPLALLLSQCTGVSHQKTSAIWEPLPITIYLLEYKNEHMWSYQWKLSNSPRTFIIYIYQWPSYLLLWVIVFLDIICIYSS